MTSTSNQSMASRSRLIQFENLQQNFIFIFPFGRCWFKQAFSQIRLNSCFAMLDRLTLLKIAFDFKSFFFSCCFYKAIEILCCKFC